MTKRSPFRYFKIGAELDLALPPRRLHQFDREGRTVLSGLAA